MRTDAECLDVQEFHRRFGLVGPDAPTMLPKDVIDYRANFMAEELNEFRLAATTGNAAGMLDALIDLVYVAKGTADMLGFTQAWGEAWDAVHDKNMQKERGPTQTRGHRLDVRKPPGWRPADLMPLLMEAGYTEAGWRQPSPLVAVSTAL